MMATSVSEEIMVGGMTIQFLVEGEQSGGSVSVLSLIHI